MTIERTESVVEKRTVNLVATQAEGLSAAIADGGLVATITCSTIDGQSTLQVPSGMVASLVLLAQTIQADPALVIPPPPPEPDPPAEPVDPPPVTPEP